MHDPFHGRRIERTVIIKSHNEFVSVAKYYAERTEVIYVAKKKVIIISGLLHLT